MLRESVRATCDARFAVRCTLVEAGARASALSEYVRPLAAANAVVSQNIPPVLPSNGGTFYGFVLQ